MQCQPRECDFIFGCQIDGVRRRAKYAQVTIAAPKPIILSTRVLEGELARPQEDTVSTVMHARLLLMSNDCINLHGLPDCYKQFLLQGAW